MWCITQLPHGYITQLPHKTTESGPCENRAFADLVHLTTSNRLSLFHMNTNCDMSMYTKCT